MPNILIADDQYEILQALKLLLKHEGFQTVMATSPEAVLKTALATPFDLILMDLNYTRDTTSGREGIDLLGHLRAMPHSPPVIVMTAWSSVPLAVEAMRVGAVDFIEKPWDNTRLLALIQQHLGSGFSRSADLEIARAVQHRLLPQELPPIETLDYAVTYEPAGEVGGDYYDFLPAGQTQGDGSTVFVVADVSGKGISAAILMATIQSYFRSREPWEFRNLATVTRNLNALFFQSSPAEQYATLFVMRYAERSGSIEWMNCGHNPPLLARRDGSFQQLDSTSTVLGLFADWQGHPQNATLNAGDTLLIFSDGLIEASDKNGEEFGVDRLIGTWRDGRQLDSKDLVNNIGNAIRAHSDGPLADDLTILALRAKSEHIPASRDTLSVDEESVPVACCS